MERSPAHEALLNYGQADAEGVMVIVSRQAIHEVSDEIESLRSSLREIAEGRGRFSMDPLEHASNTIEDMKSIALKALTQ